MTIHRRFKGFVQLKYQHVLWRAHNRLAVSAGFDAYARNPLAREMLAAAVTTCLAGEIPIPPPHEAPWVDGICLPG